MTTVITTLFGPVAGFNDASPTWQGDPTTNGQPVGGQSTVSKWLGIPYAQARRWQRPRPPTPWVAPLKCTKFGPRFPYPSIITDLIFSRKEDLIQKQQPIESEELGFNLNVFSPTVSSASVSEALPVLVWIYGGSLEGGSSDSAIYDPTEWIRRESREGRNFIVVTGNYRCGILGFMACPDLVKNDPEGLAGNYGAYDCIAILQWVQDNIRSFGGDPDNVTVFGESAGAFLIGALLVTQKKLFKQAILQSGAPDTLTHRDADSSINLQYFQCLLEYFNIPQDLTAKQRIELLSEIPTSKIMEFVAARGTVVNDYGLTIENSKSSIWPKPVIELITERKWNPYLKSLMMGHTKDEGSIFSFFFQTHSKDGFEDVLAKRCPFSPRNKIENLYPFSEESEAQNPMDLDWKNSSGSRLLADQLCESPMENLALALDGVKHHVTGELCRLFFYELNENLPSIDPRSDWGSFHAIDLPLVFNVKTLWKPNSDQAKTSALMGRIWATFGKTGCPDPSWPEYLPSTSPMKLLIEKGGNMHIEDMRSFRTDLQKRRIQFWIGQLPHIVRLKETLR